MKAIVRTKYGPADVLRLVEIDKPAPAEKEVLIKIRAASVNPYDWHLMRGTPHFIRLFTGLSKPKSSRVGADLAGEVESVGASVTQFKTGDTVFGTCRGPLPNTRVRPSRIWS
jgi:NADPH:quinone reductase-like Zn-dependent oxidoreductase